MGEETDIAEPLSSDDVVAAEDVIADEPTKDQRRKRKKHLYKSLQNLMEFYLGDANLTKDRFISQRIQGKPFVYMDLSVFLTFNKVKALTSSVEDLAKALSKSEILQVSEDGCQVCRKTPIRQKENEDDCTIYVEQLGPDVDHDLLTKVFSEFGPVDYVSMPRFSHNGKLKGFAFVEFRDPECAKKALEALNATGCCLSPHMAPEELMSIKNFDPNKENKKGESLMGSETGQDGPDTDESKTENKELTEGGMRDDEENHESTNNTVYNTETISEQHDEKRENKKRKHEDEENERVSNKKLRAKEVENNESECSTGCKGKNKQKNILKVFDTEADKRHDSESTEEVVSKKGKGKKKDKTYSPEKSTSGQPADEENIEKETVNSEEATQGKKKKRKHSADKDGDMSQQDTIKEETVEPATKKIKSDTEDGTEEEVEGVEEEAVRQKKKRKRKKKVKKEKSSALSLGLKVLPKREWKQLRNKYLNMQREMMRSLKQQLSYSRWEKPKPTVPEVEVKSGTVVKVTLEEPVVNAKAAKSEMRVHPEIRYVDVTEGSPHVYLRTTTPELATTLVQTQHWPTMQLVQGEEEIEYFNKIKMDREEHFKKEKPHQRGRTKLLKRAERFQGKHITMFESS